MTALYPLCVLHSTLGWRVMEGELLPPSLGSGLAVTSGEGGASVCLLHRTATSVIKQQQNCRRYFCLKYSKPLNVLFQENIIFFNFVSDRVSLSAFPKGLRNHGPDSVLCPPRPPRHHVPRATPPRLRCALKTGVRAAVHPPGAGPQGAGAAGANAVLRFHRGCSGLLPERWHRCPRQTVMERR